MQFSLNKGSRTRILAGLLFGAMAVFVIRLFYLQIIQHDYYVEQARAEQIKPFVQPAVRGEIYALDHGQPVRLVMNETVYTVFADPTAISASPKDIASTIQEVAGGSARANLESLLTAKKSQYQILATKVTPHQAALIKQKGYSGIGFQASTQRVYPEGQLAAQVLGFVNGDNVGQYGVEGALNNELKGTNGLLRTVTDVSGIPLTIGNNNVDIPAKNGDNVVLTIDRNVQAKAEQALMHQVEKNGAKNASVLVMDPENGHILAMANMPSYDPTDYGKVTDAAVFQNPTISSPYEPGSDIKTLTATVGVDQGVMTPDSTYDNLDHIKVDDITVGNATLGQTGTITIQHALNWSLNTGFVTVAEWLGGENAPAGTAVINDKARGLMYSYFHDRLHLGELTGVQLQGEAQGVLIPPTETEGNAVRYSNMSFGQGMDATMLQVASAFGAIVNGGTYYHPTIVAGTVSGDGDFTQAKDKAGEPQVIKPSTSDTIRQMVHDARGAFYAGSDKPGYFIGGKTGTSQVIVNGQYSQNATVGTYLGFGGEIGGPSRYVIMVRMSGDNQELAGNTDAMPVFTELSNWMIDYLNLQPKG